jgi:hypothetical protein
MTTDRIRPDPAADDGWDALAQAWQQIAPPQLPQAPAELRRRVLRADLRFRLLAAGEVLTYLALIGVVVYFLVERKGPAQFLWGFMMMWFVGWGLDFAVNIRKGLWQASDSSTEAWLGLLAERCARKRRYARTMWLMLFSMLAAMLGMFAVYWVWLPDAFARIADKRWTVAGVLLATIGIQYLWANAYLRGVAAEERELAALRSSLAVPD